MAAWNTGAATISREEAQTKITEKARTEGITGSFKVYYDGRMISSPTDLPAQVDMSKVRVSSMLDNA